MLVSKRLGNVVEWGQSLALTLTSELDYAKIKVGSQVFIEQDEDGLIRIVPGDYYLEKGRKEVEGK